MSFPLLWFIIWKLYNTIQLLSLIRPIHYLLELMQVDALFGLIDLANLLDSANVDTVHQLIQSDIR